MRETLNRCPNAKHFYKTGGMAGTYDHGDIIVAAEAVTDRAVVEDQVQDTVWNTRPGFLALALKNVAFESPPANSPSHNCHWGSAHHRIKEKNQIGIVGVITEN